MKRDRYHHGDLPAALRAAAADLLAERGVAGFSLREVARRAGVSHAAPKNHFGDVAGLLTAVAVEGFEYLHHRCVTAIEGVDDPVDALVLLGRAYVSVAIERPGHCAVVFREDAVIDDDPDYLEASDTAFGVLLATVQRLVDECAPDLDVMSAATLCWSTMQGLVDLHETMTEVAKRHATDVPEISDLAEIYTRMIVDGLLPRRARH
jgi:AcrR family transcriptional regulator